jgi:adenylate kinase
MGKEMEMNILLFGPNGSGKGTQGAILQRQFNIQHIESGVIFRDNISKKTELGKRAKQYIEKGELVPDNLTIPMILERLKQPDCARGWLLDGFPRNLNQAKKLDEVLDKEGMKLDYVMEIVLDRSIAKSRIMGRRLCIKDNNHPNNIFIEAIKPLSQEGRMICRVCGGELKTRSDDQDEIAIDQRHAIYYDKINGTLAAVNYFKDKAKDAAPEFKFIGVDGKPGVKEVSQDLLGKIKK